MTDIRRTLLWGIFLASLFFIWESWNRHNGQPSLFGSPPAATRTSAPGVPTMPAAPSTSPVGSASVPAVSIASPVSVPAAAASAVAGEQIAITTDVVRATIDGIGATLSRLELLKQVDP